MSSPASPALQTPTQGAKPATRPGAHPRSLSGLWPFLRPYRLRIGAALVFLVLAALATLAFPLALRQLVDQGLGGASNHGERLMAMREHFLALFGVGAALGLFSAGRFYMVTWLGERVTADLRNAVYRHVLRQSPEFFETTQSGEVLSRITTDTTVVQTVVGSSLSMGLRNTVMGIGAMVMLVATNPLVMGQVLGILVLVVLPALYFGRRVRKLSRASQDRVADTSAIAAEVLNAVPVVQSYTQEHAEAARFDAASESAFDTARKRTKVRSGLVAFIITATFAALLWGLYQGTQAVLAGKITAGHLGQTVVYVILLVSSVAVLAEVFGDVQRAAGATERLMELLASESPVAEAEHPLPLPAVQGGTALSLQQLQFHYPSRPLQAALADFSLDIAPGETVALVGPSGAGKSTVFQLLLRFYEAQSGSILLNGVPTDRLRLQDLRSAIGLVPQDSVIFSTSAMENIRYGRPEASDEAVRRAAETALADEFVSGLPEGYATRIGERGVTLSGGQRQRIAIARCLTMQPEVLICDESVSALDVSVQAQVLNLLQDLQEEFGLSYIFISHDLAVVKYIADQVMVMNQGKVVELANSDELYRNPQHAYTKTLLKAIPRGLQH